MTTTIGSGPLYFNGNKVNGHAVSGEHLTSNIDYWTITTSIDLANTASSTDGVSVTSESALDKVIEIVAQRGQPIIQSPITSASGVFTLKFATEHAGSWNVTGNLQTDNSASDLANAINAAGIDFGFEASSTGTIGTAGVNMVVALNTGL